MSLPGRGNAQVGEVAATHVGDSRDPYCWWVMSDPQIRRVAFRAADGAVA